MAIVFYLLFAFGSVFAKALQILFRSSAMSSMTGDAVKVQSKPKEAMIGSDWIERNWIGSRRVGLDQIGSGRVGLGRDGLIGSDVVG